MLDTNVIKMFFGVLINKYWFSIISKIIFRGTNSFGTNFVKISSVVRALKLWLRLYMYTQLLSKTTFFGLKRVPKLDISN